MSGADSADDIALDELTTVERAAALGQLPDWSRASSGRRAHMGRVAELMESWAHDLGLGEAEALRWAAAGWLHDVLREAPPAELVHLVSDREKKLPGKLLHGPAAATRLRGLVHPRVQQAIRYHTVGHARFDDLGRALYLADFLEPGREFLDDWRQELRRRMPRDRDRVLVEVLRARLQHLLESQRPILPESAEFWTSALERLAA